MPKINILVTGVGAIIGYGIINSLRSTNRNLNIIGIDIYKDAVGQYFCNHFIQAQRADSSVYIDYIITLIKQYKIDLVFLGTEQELYKVTDSRDQLKEYINIFVINDTKIIDLSKDKYKTYLFLLENGIDGIPSCIEGSYNSLVTELGSPFLLKLRRSYASKGMIMINDETDYNYWKIKSGQNFMVQKIVGDDDHEYTSSVFGLSNNKSLSPFTLRRKLSGEGATAKATVVDIPEINEYIEHISSILHPIGPTNFQFRLHDSKYLLLEVNPRISSATSIRTAFGYNETELCIQYYLERRDIEQPKTKFGSAQRYISDIINYENSTYL